MAGMSAAEKRNTWLFHSSCEVFMLDSSEKASHQQCFTCFRHIICVTTTRAFLRGPNINIVKMMTAERDSGR